MGRWDNEVLIHSSTHSLIHWFKEVKFWKIILRFTINRRIL
jgi:hypothetical protein